MSRDGSIELNWADGVHRFRLAFGELRELQEKTGGGAMLVLERLRNRSWLVDDIAETLRIGLIGGGLPPSEALQLVRRYVYERPPVENVIFATLVLGAALFGPADDPIEGKAPAPAKATETMTEESPSPGSTATGL